MKKFIILILFTVISCTPSEEDVQAIIDEAVENALETTTTTTAPPTTTTAPPTTTTSTTTTSTTTTSTTTTAPPTTTTSTTTTSTTTTAPPTTTTTVPIDELLLNYTDIKNEFPEIPYCKYKYEDVAEEINAHFKSQNIGLTIREMFVETTNTGCHGLVSGSNMQFKTIIEDGSFIEITVESTKTLRGFPTYIANSSNAKGNNERWNIYCDLTGDSYLSRDWMGEFSGNVQDYYLYSGTYVELNTPKSNCVPESVIQKLCYWGWRSNNSGEIGEQLVTGGGIVPAIYFNIEKSFPQSWDQSEMTYKCSDKEIEEISNLTTTTTIAPTSTTTKLAKPFSYDVSLWCYKDGEGSAGGWSGNYGVGITISVVSGPAYVDFYKSAYGQIFSQTRRTVYDYDSIASINSPDAKPIVYYRVSNDENELNNLSYNSFPQLDLSVGC